MIPKKIRAILPRDRKRAREHNKAVDLLTPGPRHLIIESDHVRPEVAPSGKIRHVLTRAGREALGLQ